jgi:hypothetical protein
LGKGNYLGFADNEVVVLDPSRIFNSPFDTPSIMQIMITIPQILAGTGLLNKNIREIATSVQDLMFQ